MKMIIFDLDGTLAECRGAISAEMAEALKLLLDKQNVAIITGASFEQICENVLNKMREDANLYNMSLFPTCGSSYYCYGIGWFQVYCHSLSNRDKSDIINALIRGMHLVNFRVDKIYGNHIQDKHAQITFSILGSECPQEIKKNWDTDYQKREQLRKILLQYIPQFEIKIGGTNSLDITSKGIDKAFGIKQIERYLEVKKEDMIFIGDALFPGGNDYAVKEYGVDCVSVSSPDETLSWIQSFLKNGIVEV